MVIHKFKFNNDLDTVQKMNFPDRVVAPLSVGEQDHGLVVWALSTPGPTTSLTFYLMTTGEEFTTISDTLPIYVAAGEVKYLGTVQLSFGYVVHIFYEKED